MHTMINNPHLRKIARPAGSLLLLLLCLASFAALWPSAPAGAEEGAGGKSAASGYERMQDQFGPFYWQVRQRWEQAAIPLAEREIHIPAAAYSRVSDSDAVRVGDYRERSDVLIWRDGSDNWVEFEFEAPAEGRYELTLDYHHVRESDADESPARSLRPSVIAISVDGEYPFREARSIKLPRYFRDELPLRLDRHGDHIRPQSVEIERWSRLPVTDYDDSYGEALQWHLTAGKHILRISGSAPLALDRLSFGPPVRLPNYEEALERYPAFTGRQHAPPIVLEAEWMAEKNEVSIQMLSDQDAFMSPKAEGRMTFNGVGGSRWNDGGETITWAFDVAEDGWYNIGLRALNNLQSNVTNFRTLRIDGDIPFAEMTAFGIPYHNKWQSVTIADADGAPYAFYLEAGAHTLSLGVTYSPHKEVQMLMTEALQELNVLSRDLQVLTRGADDMNRTWDIAANYPEIPQRLAGVGEILERMAGLWLAVNGQKDNNYQSLQTSISDIAHILRYPNEIPYKKSTLSTVQTKVASIAGHLTVQPVALDQIVIVPHESAFPRMTATFWEKLKSSTANFFRSFTKGKELSENDGEVLNVWMYYGRDYVNLLQELADQYFTPMTGIPVKIDLLPREDLLVLANATGKVPDVALGIGEGKPSEFAFRNSAVDLSQFPGFDQLTEHFAPGAMLPYYYDGGYYAVPETMHVKMLYYRKDILDHLNLDVPDTWEDVYAMLPTLQQNGYNFFIPTGEFLTFIYQNGADFYTPDGMRTGLDSPEGFSAFKQVTDLFSIYGIERQIPSFYQHFRDGDMPVGIADLNMYLQLLVAAPELTGWWGMAPLPGVRNEAGVVERWSGGDINMLSQGLGGFGGGQSGGSAGQTSAMIMKKADNPDWGWSFIRWWLSPEVQQQFGSELEGFYGAQFRWNTANLSAFSRLPWTREELPPILEQWRWYKSMVNVPGSYFIPRELNNAWNRTVIDGMNFRRSLEMGVMNINRELIRKQSEFGYRDEAGNVLRSLDLPAVNLPWEGVDRYVQP